MKRWVLLASCLSIVACGQGDPGGVMVEGDSTALSSVESTAGATTPTTVLSDGPLPRFWPTYIPEGFPRVTAEDRVPGRVLERYQLSECVPTNPSLASGDCTPVEVVIYPAFDVDPTGFTLPAGAIQEAVTVRGVPATYVDPSGGDQVGAFVYWREDGVTRLAATQQQASSETLTSMAAGFDASGKCCPPDDISVMHIPEHQETLLGFEGDPYDEFSDVAPHFYVIVSERPMAEIVAENETVSQATATRVSVRGHDGRFVWDTLIWEEDGYTVEVWQLEQTTALAVAESLEQIDDATYRQRLGEDLVVEDYSPYDGPYSPEAVTALFDPDGSEPLRPDVSSAIELFTIGRNGTGAWCNGGECHDDGTPASPFIVGSMDASDGSGEVTFFGVVGAHADHVELRRPDGRLAASVPTITPIRGEGVRVFLMEAVQGGIPAEAGVPDDFHLIARAADGTELARASTPAVDLLDFTVHAEEWAAADVVATFDGWDLRAVRTPVRSSDDNYEPTVAEAICFAAISGPDDVEDQGTEYGNCILTDGADSTDSLLGFARVAWWNGDGEPPLVVALVNDFVTSVTGTNDYFPPVEGELMPAPQFPGKQYALLVGVDDVVLDIHAEPAVGSADDGYDFRD